MKDRPILMNGAMVRATQREIDPKSQTRRMIDRLLGFGAITEFDTSDTSGYAWHFRDHVMRWNDFTHARLLECCPYGQPGDHLWVRETHSVRIKPEDASDGVGRVWYAADGVEYLGGLKWTPSIHMFRWASRILLEIVSVRVERLHDISRGDAMAEGCPFPNMAQGDDPRKWYADLWNSINGPGSWDANPWVWVIEFKRAKP